MDGRAQNLCGDHHDTAPIAIRVKDLCLLKPTGSKYPIFKDSGPKYH